MRRIERPGLIAAAGLLALAAACPTLAAPSPDLAQLSATAPPVPSAPRSQVDPARLVIATEIAAMMMPPGSLRHSMQNQIERTKSFVSNNMLNAQMLVFIRAAGIKPVKQIAIDEETATAAMRTLDPAFDQRQRINFETIDKRLSAIIDDHEPMSRAVIAEAFARRLPEADLAALLAFLKTSSGAAYAATMTTLTSDPAMDASSVELGMQLEAAIKSTTTEIANASATSGLPRSRLYTDLSASEKAEIFELIGATPTWTPVPDSTPTASPNR